MLLLDRYVGRHVAFSTLLVLGLLLSLFAIFSFLDELTRVGRGNYSTLDAIQYVGLLLPGLIYQLFPIAALLGSTIGLGIMASHNELTIMRAAGVSLNRIIWSVMRVGLVMVALTLVIGESIAPVAEQYARTLRSVAISDKLAIRGKSHLWARDGDSFVNVRDILPGERLANVYIYDRDDEHRISQMIQAKSAAYRNDKWVLEDVLTSRIDGHSVVSTHQDRLVWNTSLSPDLLGVVTLHPGTMSVRGLYQYIDYLNKNGLDASIYRHAMWAKIVAPLVTGVMVFLAIPFVFGPLRSVGIGHRILVGALAGIGFYLLNQMSSYMGIVYNFNPVVVALLPTIMVFGLAYWMLSRVR